MAGVFPRSTATVSTGIPFSKSEVENRCRKRWAWPPCIPAFSKTRSKVLSQILMAEFRKQVPFQKK